MPDKTSQPYDILIAGAGFAGSLMALILHNLGYKVCLVEKGQHPRFAIGESSTPIADMILRKLAAEYNLPWLADFSRYGSWQQSHPEIVCGLKRGFSYFKHYPGQVFSTDAEHENELFVAASTDDTQSDTNWLRADFDAFVVNKVKEAGIDYFELTEIISAKRDGALWEFSAATINIEASFFIDGTGSGVLLDKLLGIKSTSDDFLTNSFAIFSHFNDVKRWTEMLQEAGISTNDFPYDPDNSALHQVLDEGWLWMLRFNDERTSFGFALDGHEKSIEGLQTEQIWNDLLKKYPSINDIIKNASLHPQPGAIMRSGRLQRRLTKCFGDGWVALPHTAGFVDPLFSTGIAHSLAGIQKIATIFSDSNGNDELLYQNLKEYEYGVFVEIEMIDKLVAGCYQTMKYFELFNAWSMLYFAATITYEQQLLNGDSPGYFLKANDPYILKIINLSYSELLAIIDNHEPKKDDIQNFTARIKDRIAPINTAGLLDPSLKNMYRHTAAKL